MKLRIPWAEYKVVEQPVDQVTWVSRSPDEVTRFQWSKGLGLLGESQDSWQMLNLSDVLKVDEQQFTVTEIHYFQVIDPAHFSENGVEMDSRKVLERFYSDPDGLTLQTCLGGAGGVRLFVVAEPNRNADLRGSALLRRCRDN